MNGMSNKRSHSIDLRNYLYLLWCACWVLVLILVSWLWRIAVVSCHHVSRSCTVAEEESVARLSGERMLFLRIPSQITQDLTRQGVKISTWQLTLPRHASVILEDQERIVIVKDNNTNQIWMVSSDWQIISLPENTTPPLISVESALLERWQQDHKIVEADALQLAALEKKLQELDIEQSLILADKTIIITMPDKQLILDLPTWREGFGRWDMLNSHFDWTSVTEQVFEVDLRYTLPVLRTARTLPRHN